MPRKTRLYVPKGASRKSTKNAAPSSSPACKDAPTCSDGMEEVTTASNSIQVASPTARNISVEAIVTTADVSCQTDFEAFDELAEDEDLPEPEKMCEGNNDIKFHPLIIKHEGIFTNHKGTVS